MCALASVTASSSGGGNNLAVNVVGAMSLDDCNNTRTGSCYGNCGVECQENEYHISYSYFVECDTVEGGIVCQANTNAQKSSQQCGEDMGMHCGCSNMTASGYLQDCGPPAGETAPSGFCVTAGMPKIGCVNTALCACGTASAGNIGVRLYD